jgi:hypothetical protein
MGTFLTRLDTAFNHSGIVGIILVYTILNSKDSVLSGAQLLSYARRM